MRGPINTNFYMVLGGFLVFTFMFLKSVYIGSSINSALMLSSIGSLVTVFGIYFFIQFVRKQLSDAYEQEKLLKQQEAAVAALEKQKQLEAAALEQQLKAADPANDDTQGNEVPSAQEAEAVR